MSKTLDSRPTDFSHSLALPFKRIFYFICQRRKVGNAFSSDAQILRIRSV